ncbi:MAG TPA: CotH kinase family protein [Candidatus Limnocylindria bacterium]|nr:CotH kinase family protein [Candidatus Limnocylindria bacterium]
MRSPWSLLPKSGWKRWLAIFFVLFGSFFLLIVTLVVAAILAWQSPNFQGWVMSKMIEHQVAGFPEEHLDAPAPTPSYHGFEPDAHQALSAADLYRPTNLWNIHLRFTEAQWRALGPNHVPPLTGFIQPDGRPLLHNPRAPRAGLAGVLGLDYPWSAGDVEFGGVTLTNVGIRYKGNGTFLNSMGTYKRPFKLDLNHTVKGQKLAGVSTFNLGNLAADRSFLSDTLGYEFFREAGIPASRTAYARVFLTIAGKTDHRLLGLYVMAENPDDTWARTQFGRKGAALFKPVTYELFADIGTNWPPYAEIYDPKTKLTHEQEDRMMALARFVTHSTDAEFAEQLGDYFDFDKLARYFACEVLLANYDGILSNGQNFLLYLDPRSNRFGFIPWDLDHSWGEFPHLGTADLREQASIWHPWIGQNHFLERLFAAPTFKVRYRAALEHLLATQFVPDRLKHRLDELAPLIRPAIAEWSTNRLSRFDIAVSSAYYDGPRDGDPESPNHPVWQLKRFFETRAANVRDQLDGKVEGKLVLRKH